MAAINGKTVLSMKENFTITTSQERESSIGQMEAITQEKFQQVRDKVLVSTPALSTIRVTRDFGEMDRSKAKEF